MKDRFKEELKLIEIMRMIDKKVSAMSELFDGDVELFSDVMDEMDILLAELLIKKGVYVDLGYVYELVRDEITLDEIIKLNKEYRKEILSGNH